ncbi:MAG: hypothetical protein FWD60_11325 [Candidatus Azobacteroides sp.]|nr:hypothetical protein [Candidatus Azobacteroides sp.]
MNNNIVNNHVIQENLVKIKVQTELLQRIARYLMLHSSFTDNIGLLNGKTGIAFFFYHYASYTKRNVYSDFADELIDQIYKEIHINIPLNFKDGLCGIAWSIEYLIQNGFIEGDPDEVLEDLDKRIVEWDVRRVSDYSLETGLTGIACYVISRMKNSGKKNSIICSDYIYELIEAIKRNGKNINPSLIETLENILNGSISIQSWNPVFEIIDKTKYNINKIFESSRSLGIDKAGYAGIGLKIMGINKQ